MRGTLKLDFSPENELNDVVFLKSKFCIFEKPSSPIEPKNKGVQSDKTYTTEKYKNCLEKKQHRSVPKNYFR